MSQQTLEELVSPQLPICLLLDHVLLHQLHRLLLQQVGLVKLGLVHLEELCHTANLLFHGPRSPCSQAVYTFI